MIVVLVFAYWCVKKISTMHPSNGRDNSKVPATGQQPNDAGERTEDDSLNCSQSAFAIPSLQVIAEAF